MMLSTLGAMRDGRYRLRAVLTLALTAAIAGCLFAGVTQGSFCPLSASVGRCQPLLQFDLEGAFTPKQLPKREFAPVALRVSGKVALDDGEVPPPLREMTVYIDRNGVLDASGLPACPFRQLKANDTDAIRRVCARSLVGTGVAHIGVLQKAPIRATLSLFNGGVSNGVTKLLVQGVLASGVSEPIVTAMKISPIARGRYGWEAVLKVPPLLGGSGSVLDFDLRIKRRFASQGVERSYLAARCRDGHLQAGVRAVFATQAAPAEHAGAVMEGTVVRPCTTRG
jgi:hypothetical protein